VAWVVDLLTPQLFVAAILLNGPIALSGLALRARLTIALTVFAQIANIAAGYFNGVQDGYHWQPIAIGDRILSAASFLLVGYLTVRAQELARGSGIARERQRRAHAETRLRRCLDDVRASLNVDLVLRAITRQTVTLFGARTARLIVRKSALAVPDTYSFSPNDADIDVARRPLDAHVASLFQRVSDGGRAVRIVAGDTVAQTVIDGAGARSAIAVPIAAGDIRAMLFLFFDTAEPDHESERMAQEFAEGATVALQQARLFTQLGAQNDEIARQKDALQERSRVIRDIVYALAHDLRTPLAAAQITVRQALDGAYGDLPEAYREILRTTLASNDDVRRLVETLLLVARYESGEDSTLRERVDLRIAAERVLAELRPMAEAKGVALESRFADSPVVVEGDPSELRRALTNLIANAITATPHGGRVGLLVDARSERVHLDVEDTGFGVPVERRAQLFERFSQDAGGMGSGTGLGLYIVRRIVEKHGGSATYAPGSDGGSIFSLDFPKGSPA
jgi:signal transduction histidine kinase